MAITTGTFIAEIIGTFIFLLAIVTLAFRSATTGSGATDHMVQAGSIPLFIGLGLAVAIYITIGLGGSGHLNPLVSIVFGVNGNISSTDAIIMICAQIIGAAAAFGVFKSMPNTLPPF